MEILRKVASFGASVEDMREIYYLFVRSQLEQSAVVWHSSLTEEDKANLERVQKSALKIMMRGKYISYEQALADLGILSLDERRENLCLNFARKCLKNDKSKHMFPMNEKEHEMKTRNHEIYKVQHANTGRLQKSPLIYMQKLLNSRI